MFAQLHKLTDGSYAISADGVWMPGAYESAEAAELAFGFPDVILQRLQDAANNRSGGIGGTITLADLRSVTPS